MKITRRSIFWGAAGFVADTVMPSWELRADPRAETNKANPWSRFWVGTSYYPEQWSKDAWTQDFAKMGELGVNTVRMGEFAWSSLEPAEGRFEFGWLDDAIALATRRGISVLLGTPTAGIPPWLYARHPDVLGANDKGPYTYGGRKGFSLYSPAMRAAAKRVITALAERYGNNPGVIGWQLSNEPGFPMTDFSMEAQSAFRTWLKQRYGTLEKLNAAWSGAFWSNTYGAWEEIVFPTNSAEGGWNPALSLDYRRFFSDSFLGWLRFEAAIIREYEKNQFIYTNWPDARWSVDIREAQTFLDAAAWDNYSKMPGAAEPYQVIDAGLDHDLCRGSRMDQRFFVAEQPSQSYADVPDTAIRLSTYIDLAHGAAGTMFFEWRPPAIGAERGYVSILEADGSFGRSVEQFRRLKQELDLLYPQLATARTVAKIALLYSYTDQWEQGSSWVPKGKRTYDGVCERYYGGARSLQQNVDVIGLDRDLSSYRIVFAPLLRLMSDDEAARLLKFVELGGMLVLDHGAGTLDVDARLRPSIEPGPFRKAAGVRIPASLESHRDPQGIGIRFSETTDIFTATESVAHVELEGASVLATFTGEGMEGSPAVTMHSCGKGQVVFVAASLSDRRFFETLSQGVGKRMELAPLLPVPLGVTVLSRSTENEEFLFVINLNRHAVVIELQQTIRDVLSGKTLRGSRRLEALDLAILARSRMK